MTENAPKCSWKEPIKSSFCVRRWGKLFDLCVLSLVHIGGFCPFGRGPCWQNEQGEIKRMFQCDLANNELSASQNVSFSTQNNTMNSRISPHAPVCVQSNWETPSPSKSDPAEIKRSYPHCNMIWTITSFTKQKFKVTNHSSFMLLETKYCLLSKFSQSPACLKTLGSPENNDIT